MLAMLAPILQKVRSRAHSGLMVLFGMSQDAERSFVDVKQRRK
jgi:hypothetical protein